MRTAVCAIACLVAVAGSAEAQGTRAQFELRGRPQVGVPFQIDLVVQGFDESPAPAQPKLEIAGTTITPIGVTPSVSRSIQIINGRRIDSTRVSWNLSYRVLPSKPGSLRVPALTVTQGAKSATAVSGQLDVEAVAIADDMKLELELPDRAVFVGETVPVNLVWLFRREPSNQSFSVPVMNLDAFSISTPPAVNTRNVLEFTVGPKTMKLAYVIDPTPVNVGGVAFKRLTVTFFMAPKKTGKVTVPASTVVAELAVGRADFFGNAPTRAFRASDVDRTIEVKPLPESDRPAHFAGAVGEQFSIEVRTSRSVVQLGEPVELDITVKSNQRLDTLDLGKLDGEGRLPKDKFTAPAESPTGELSDDGKTKRFAVVAQVAGPATEVPALAFSYFDPRKGAYQTIHSEPIALSVKGSAVVGANDVVAATPQNRAGSAAPVDDTSLVNAQLALSSNISVGDRPLGGTLLWLLIGVLYAVPLAVFALRTWRLRTADRREEAAEVRTARRRVEDLLDRAGAEPAREIAGPLAAALRDFARVLGRSIEGNEVLGKLETESFAPSAVGEPLSADVRSNTAGLLRRLATDERRSRGATKAAVAVALAVLAAPSYTRADSLGEGRAAYQQAMELAGDPSARRAAFARAAVSLGDAARTAPDRHELLADWGNAALGAGDLATATLAYRRALALDAGNPRALHNLAWLRGRQPDAFRPSASAGATDTLLFFHHWPRPRRLLVGAIAFAIAILFAVPWTAQRPRSGRRRSFAALSILPFAIWIAMLASVVLEDRRADDAVVMDSVVMRAADSAGAPAALSQPLPRGAEVTLLERRDAWTRIRIANGTTGWIPSGAVERVMR